MLIDADKLFDRLMEELRKNDLPGVEDPIRADAYRIGRNAGLHKALDILHELRDEALKKKVDDITP